MTYYSIKSLTYLMNPTLNIKFSTFFLWKRQPFKLPQATIMRNKEGNCYKKVQPREQITSYPQSYQHSLLILLATSAAGQLWYSLFYSYTFGQITRLINIATAIYCNVIRKQLQGNNRKQG